MAGLTTIDRNGINDDAIKLKASVHRTQRTGLVNNESYC